ncbi:ImmA/IrrE family metallo-endopeptidase [Staphylococcus felis]|uniref:ImmA/IrrE family metallo-endopeptidase n=1 Tax=Staphylococcus felis TaxID=46127 RepID=UPI0025A3DC60|nr:ImmA/IrrE family metallo-endopeptidase [Staphylococcus felis]MDM8326536.1 ImmA/IrrE family metallo-endopeptidase [Staphylococcus felis]
MGKYEELLNKYKYIDIEDKFCLPGNFKGFLDNEVILIDRNLTNAQKHEVLAEEIAHYKFSAGDILDQSDVLNRKFENYARRHAKEMIITLEGITEAFKQGIHNLYELANFFEVSESFVLESIEHYKMKYGLSTECKGYLIQFEPLTIYKNIND